MIKYIKQHIRTMKFVKLMKQDIKNIYGDITYEHYLDYVQSEKFKVFIEMHARDKQLNQLGL